jgi:aspartyl-tRNA(Asn)/glutamyl-tRNA(Gln) amidotransferase subunit A
MHQKTLPNYPHLHSKQVPATELAQHFSTYRASDLNAFLHVDPELTLRWQAAAADVRLANGDATALTGIPIAHKDIFVTKNLRFDCRFTHAGKLCQPIRCNGRHKTG